MAAHTAPVKTQLGLDELRGRARTLGQRHRTVLLLVDGRRPLSEVLGMALQAGAQTSHFEDLVRMGMVELPSAEPPQEVRDSAPSVFDALRVTTVELEVPAARPSAAADESPLPAVTSTQSPAAVARPAASGRDTTAPSTPLPAPARGADNPSSRAGALGPPVVPDPGAAPTQDILPSLQERQLPLAAVVKPAVEAPPSLPQTVSAPMPVAQVRAPAAPAPVPSRRMPLEPAPGPRPGQPVNSAQPVPAPRPSAAPTAPRLPTRPDHASAPPGPNAAASAPVSINPRVSAPTGAPRAVPNATPARLAPLPPQLPQDRASTLAATAKGIPTLPEGAATPAARAPGRRSVLNRLASPRAGSLRVPDEPAETRLERVRELLVETLRIDAPLFGMRMLVRLRAAVNADDLIELVWDIERHLITARHSRDEMLNLQRARELLGLGNTVVADDDDAA